MAFKLMFSDRKPALLVILAAATSCFIATTVLLPVEFMNGLLRPLNSLVYTYIPWLGISAGKFGHIVAFFLLTFCAIAISRRFGISLPVLLSVLFAFSVATELSQLLVDGRHTRFRDLLFNLSGVSLALLGYYSARAILSLSGKLNRE
jgi:glycopeptide antibiotics resistance protein